MKEKKLQLKTKEDFINYLKYTLPNIFTDYDNRNMVITYDNVTSFKINVTFS